MTGGRLRHMCKAYAPFFDKCARSWQRSAPSTTREVATRDTKHWLADVSNTISSTIHLGA